MKKIILIYPIIVSVLVLLLTTDCKKEELASLAVLSTTSATNTTETTATSGGFITSDGGATITARGVCWNTTSNPTTSDSKTTDGVGIGQFVSEITGLTAGLTHHVRAYATNSIGTAYGADMTFTTTPLIDIDGNSYNAIRIGTQVWMKENLKTTKYNDGTVIPNITDNTAWDALTTGAYSDYSNTPANSTTYGRLYNWYAVDNNAATKVASNGGKNVCPTGWHVPSDAEWTVLTDYLTNNGYGYGGSGIDIGKSMANTSGWTRYRAAGNVGNDQASNNSSGFTAFPSGYRFVNGPYYNIGGSGHWWCSTEYNAGRAYYRVMFYNFSIVRSGNFNKEFGFSVRCLRD